VPSPPQLYTLSLHDALPISPQFHAENLSRECQPNCMVWLSSLSRSALLTDHRNNAEWARWRVGQGGFYGNRGSDGYADGFTSDRSEEHTSELQSRGHLVCRL